MNPELERLLELVKKVSQGLGETVTITQISQQPITEDGRLYERREGSIEVNGEIKDLVHQNLRLFMCGHVASTKTFGGICSEPHHDYRNLPVLNRALDPSTPFMGCKECLRYRCIRCRKLLCVHHVRIVRSLPGIIFCERCSRARKWEDFFGFFFGRR